MRLPTLSTVPNIDAWACSYRLPRLEHLKLTPAHISCRTRPGRLVQLVPWSESISTWLHDTGCAPALPLCEVTEV